MASEQAQLRETRELDLVRENEALKRQLAEAQDTIRAIQGGEVDALVVTADKSPVVVTLDSPDRPYRLLVEQMRQAAATLGMKGEILYCNSRFAELLGRPQAGLAGMLLRDFVEESNRPIFDVLLQDGAAAPVEGEVVLSRPQGGGNPVYFGVTAHREGPAGMCLIIADLSEQKRRERLVADEAMSRSILEQVADAVVVCDPDGVVVRASRTAHALCGENPIMQRFVDVFPLRERSAAGDVGAGVNIAGVWKGQTVRGLPVLFKSPAGVRFELLLSASPLVAAGGDTLGAVVTLTNITELRHAEFELRRQAGELQQADKRKDEFLAMLAHELRNPLAPIRSSLEIMHLCEIDEPHVRRSRDVIGRQVQQLTRLVDDLLEVSRISSGKIQLRPEKVDLRTVISQAVEAGRPAIDAKRHQLTVQLPDVPLHLNADPARLAQVFGNILNNAAKYTENGGRITVSVAEEGGEALVRIRDTGIGIPPEMLAKVFDLFTQVDQSLARAQGGLGIGLALVKRLLSLHGAKVIASSDGVGLGSEFTVVLPLASGAEEGATHAGSSGDRTAGRNRRRILVVDDSKDAAESLHTLLGMLGHEVRTAIDGPAAIKAAAEFRPHVVLCDIGLPTMNGYEVVRELRVKPELAATRFVALTGYGREDDLKRSEAAGFHLHLIKPFDLPALEAALNLTE